MLNEEVARYRELSGDTNPNVPISRIGGYLDGYEKALEQEPCEDAISRQAVLDINESHHGQMPNHINYQIWQEINELPPVNPQPCEDAISRQDVLDLAKKGVLISNGNYESVCKAINELPPVNPQPKTGYISIDDVMSVFDDFMRGEVDEDGTDTFLKMLKDRAESEDKE